MTAARPRTYRPEGPPASLLRMQFSLSRPKLLWKTMLAPRTIAGLLAALGILFVGHWGLTAEKKEARVTQIVKDVRLLASKTGSRHATVNEPVPEGVAVRTGTESRAELTFTDQTLTRLGANTIFSFGNGARDFDLTSGALLMCVPKEKGEVRVNTAAATAAVTGGVAMVETHSAAWCKFI